ncbi:MAG: recombinase family protein [Desulfuromonadaceae bacterium]|nr:recombinase family protein [Desulfuromonadaceae bacterium]MDD5104872.1 recombinase family protein [Desulfuromonadaceae bacterium]
MAKIGYARVSTIDQELTAQLEQLQGAGVDKVFKEKASGVKQDRPQLAAMLDHLREGDTVVVTKLDRVARSTRHLLQIVDTLEAKKVSFKVLNINLDTSTPTGKLMLSMLAAIAEFERSMMLERQKEGIRLAKEAGRYQGRKPTAKAQAVRVMELIAQGKTKQAIADEVGIGVASVYRIMKVQNAKSKKTIDLNLFIRGTA